MFGKYILCMLRNIGGLHCGTSGSTDSVGTDWNSGRYCSFLHFWSVSPVFLTL